MIIPFNARFPSILGRSVFLQWSSLPFSPIEILTIGPAGNGVVGPKQFTLTQFGQEEIHNIVERGGK